MFPFSYIVVLQCMWAGGLIDNATINTRKIKGVDLKTIVV